MILDMQGAPIPDRPPRALRVPGGKESDTHELDATLVAVHGAQPSGERNAPDGPPRSTLEGGAITVWPAGEAPAGVGRLGPVYRAGQGGPLAIPTGRLFVRFREGNWAEHQRDALSAAGFALESVPAYAPHAAWVRPSSGRIADALADLDRLVALPGLEHVEPQLVSEAARRG